MTETLERAITIHQPWAWAVASGHCPVINSLTRPPLEAVGELIGIHAGKGGGTIDHIDCVRRLGPALAGQMPIIRPEGALIGVARLVGVVRQIPVGTARGNSTDYQIMAGRSVGLLVPTETRVRIRPWWRGPWGWLLDEVVLLPEPIPMRGQQGLWRIPTALMDHPTRTEWRCTAGAWALEQWRKARETR